jgi:uracil-DNA glycosylase family 4
MISIFDVHRNNWINCRRCLLCEKRKKVVLARGSIPCDIVLCGEGPGQSEDVLGYPFAGPAGHLLNRMMAEGFRGKEHLKIALTNLVGCIPLEGVGKKAGEPPRESIEACSPRLIEFVEICRPKLLVMVGRLAEKWCPVFLGTKHAQRFVSIVHPSAILQADVTQKGLLIQRNVVTLQDAVEDL